MQDKSNFKKRGITKYVTTTFIMSVYTYVRTRKVDGSLFGSFVWI